MEKIDDVRQKFLWCQLYGAEKEKETLDISKILKKICKIYKKMREDSFLVFLLTGDSNNQQTSYGFDRVNNSTTIQKGRCFIKHKNSEIETLDELIRAISLKKNGIQ